MTHGELVGGIRKTLGDIAATRSVDYKVKCLEVLNNSKPTDVLYLKSTTAFVAEIWVSRWPGPWIPEVTHPGHRKVKSQKRAKSLSELEIAHLHLLGLGKSSSLMV